MDKILIYRILLFSLIPIGIYTSVLTYRLGMKIFKGKVYCEIFVDNLQCVNFTVPKDGYCGVWQKGDYLMKTYADKYKAVITNMDTQTVVKLSRSYMSPSSNNSKKADMELYWFKAKAGNYKLELTDGSMLTGVGSALSNVVPGTQTSRQNYSIQVRESAFPGSSFVFILAMLASMLCIIGGGVCGALADKIIK